MAIDQSVINFAVYEDSVEYLGMSKATLPDVTFLTQSISGAGVGGNVEAVILGHLEAMTLGLEFRTTTPQSVRLSELRRHSIDLRVANQYEDPVSGVVEARKEKHIFVVVPKSTKGGTIAPATPTSGSGEYAVRYWATYINGKKVRELDPPQLHLLHQRCGLSGRCPCGPGQVIRICRSAGAAFCSPGLFFERERSYPA